ncbi:GD19838 [Drosophila simulans]|uniref:GD19838 n=1 Tax=Drosophila simulans TaxID=7240 RepID=B4QXP1_DROSI|nr:GD19838 [Drosophila simulans]
MNGLLRRPVTVPRSVPAPEPVAGEAVARPSSKVNKHHGLTADGGQNAAENLKAKTPERGQIHMQDGAEARAPKTAKSESQRSRLKPQDGKKPPKQEVPPIGNDFR